MTTTINASNSGSGGLVQTADASGILALQTAGTTALTIDTSQNATFANALTTTGYANLPNTFGFKNRIINGAMVIDQRNAGASAGTASGTFAYFLDRWVASYSQTSKFTVQQNAGAITPPSGFTNYLGVTSSSAYSVVSSDTFNMQQPIEGFNVADLGWGAAGAQTVTVSFWVRSSLTGTFGGALSNSNLTRSYPFSYTISSANTWEYKTITIAGDISGTWVTNSGVGLRLYFNLGAGATYSGTAGAWAGTNYQSATGATSVVGTNGATFYITGVQLEKGSTATSFDVRSYGTELDLCQRYYEQYNFGSRTSMFGGAQGNSTAEFLFRYMVTKRASPTVSINNYLAYRVNDWRGGDQQANGFTVNESDTIQARFQFTKATSNLTTGYVVYMNRQSDSGLDPTLYISAEL
jgi:hypothetical protein